MKLTELEVGATVEKQVRSTSRSVDKMHKDRSLCHRSGRQFRAKSFRYSSVLVRRDLGKSEQ